jgi:fructokinase
MAGLIYPPWCSSSGNPEIEKSYGGIEAGGTKFVCAVGDAAGRILEQARIETSAPTDTLEQAAAFFMPFVRSKKIQGIGLASFGPIDLDRASPTFGHITSTPKQNWRNTDIVGILQAKLHVNVQVDTDVNAAALAEHTWGASRDLDPSLFLTIGTGIGGGYLHNGASLTGLTHPEMGHIRLARDPRIDDFPGTCPYHGDCFEGLASGPALAARAGRSPNEIADIDPIWNLEMEYIGQAIADLVLVLSPRIIVLGGGVMHRDFLFAGIRRKVQQALNAYVQHALLLESMDTYIVPPLLGDAAGVLGAIALARNADQARP